MKHAVPAPASFRALGHMWLTRHVTKQVWRLGWHCSGCGVSYLNGAGVDDSDSWRIGLGGLPEHRCDTGYVTGIGFLDNAKAEPNGGETRKWLALFAWRLSKRLVKAWLRLNRWW